MESDATVLAVVRCLKLHGLLVVGNRFHGGEVGLELLTLKQVVGSLGLPEHDLLLAFDAGQDGADSSCRAIRHSEVQSGSLGWRGGLVHRFSIMQVLVLNVDVAMEPLLSPCEPAFNRRLLETFA